jgi:malate synthase
MIPHTGIIDPWSTKFIDELVREFRDEHDELLKFREEMKNSPTGIQAYVDLPSPHAMKNHIWSIRPIPHELIDRRVEITGPAIDPKMAITALNSGASGYMVDGEDSLSPTWENVLRTQSTLTGIVRRTLRANVDGIERTMNPKTAVLHYRPRGLHMFERHWIVDGQPAPACLVDVGLFLWWNAKEMLSRKQTPCLYLPKTETEHDTRFWGRVLSWIEKKLEIHEWSVRVTVLIETLPALIRAETIIWSLRERITGLNVGRWDYMLSLVRHMHADIGYVLPDRSEMTMDSPALEEYARWVVRVAHRRGAHAIGGMAAQVPSRKDPAAAARALDAVHRDKVREVSMGHDGTWVAHPDLVGVAFDAFNSELKGDVEQRWVMPGREVTLDLATAMRLIDGKRTEHGLRDAVRTSLLYVDSWLRGAGCVAMDGKMEDAATAEISRALLWQWVARGAVLDDGTKVDANRVVGVIRGEAGALVASGTEPHMDAISLLERSILIPRLPDHILTSAYESLVNKNSR